MVRARAMRTVSFWCVVASALLASLTASVWAAEPIKVGSVAALSGQSAKSGEGLTRGLTIVIDEINARGGLLGGRQLALIRRDDESNPSKGQIAARELIFKEGVAVLFGGIDSPVSLAIVPLANKEKIPLMGVWAAATPITRNGANPNFVFRVSAVDELVDKALGGAGMLIAPLYNVSSDMGTLFGIKAFAVAILGGITSAWGVMLAGCSYGIIEALITALFGSPYINFVTFTLVIIALTCMPHGLFGRAGVKKV